MARPQKIAECVRLSVVLSKAQANRVKHMAIQMSAREGRQITVSEAIRMAVESLYPLPKNMQTDLFK